jgi:hypothetical protein
VEVYQVDNLLYYKGNDGNTYEYHITPEDIIANDWYIAILEKSLPKSWQQYSTMSSYPQATNMRISYHFGTDVPSFNDGDFTLLYRLTRLRNYYNKDDGDRWKSSQGKFYLIPSWRVSKEQYQLDIMFSGSNKFSLFGFKTKELANEFRQYFGKDVLSIYEKI